MNNYERGWQESQVCDFNTANRTFLHVVTEKNHKIPQSRQEGFRDGTFDETGYNVIIVRMSRVELRWKSPRKDCNNRF